MEEFIWVFSFITAVGTAAALFAGSYTFLTTQDVRSVHHQQLETGLLFLSSASYIAALRRTILAIGRLLSWVYGRNDHAGRVRDFFTMRAWQASLTIAVTYSFVGPPIILTGFLIYGMIALPDTNPFQFAMLMVPLIALIFGLAIVRSVAKRPAGGVRFRLRGARILLEAERQTSQMRWILILTALVFLNGPPQGNEDSQFATALVILSLTGCCGYLLYFFLANIWAFGVRGLGFFLVLVIVLFTRIAFFAALALTAFLFLHPALSGLSDNPLAQAPRFAPAVIVAGLIALSLSARQTRTGRIVLRAVAGVLGLTVLAAMKADGGTLDVLFSLASLFLIVFAIITGFVVANSLLDLVSVSASRHFFRRASFSLGFGQLTRFLAADLVIAMFCMIGAALVFLASIAFALALYHLYFLIFPPHWLTLYGAEPSVLYFFAESAVRAATLPGQALACTGVGPLGGFQACMAYAGEARPDFLERAAKPESIDAFGLILTAFFATTALPTLINAATMIAAIALKSASRVISGPCLKAHAALQSSGRVDIFVGAVLSLATLTAFLIYFGGANAP